MLRPLFEDIFKGSLSSKPRPLINLFDLDPASNKDVRFFAVVVVVVIVVVADAVVCVAVGILF